MVVVKTPVAPYARPGITAPVERVRGKVVLLCVAFSYTPCFLLSLTAPRNHIHFLYRRECIATAVRMAATGVRRAGTARPARHPSAPNARRAGTARKARHPAPTASLCVGGALSTLPPTPLTPHPFSTHTFRAAQGTTSAGGGDASSCRQQSQPSNGGASGGASTSAGDSSSKPGGLGVGEWVGVASGAVGAIAAVVGLWLKWKGAHRGLGSTWLAFHVSHFQHIRNAHTPSPPPPRSI